jgi:transcriptional regulator with XRE-family HTH domain
MRCNADMKEVKKFATKIRTRRHELRLSQEKVAEMIGYHVNQYGRIERGTVDPCLTFILRLSKALELDLGKVLSDL